MARVLRGFAPAPPCCICHTERCEVSHVVLVRINPSPQSSPQGEEEKYKSSIRHAVSLASTKQTTLNLLGEGSSFPSNIDGE